MLISLPFLPSLFARTGALILVGKLSSIQARKLVELRPDIMLNLIVASEIRNFYRVLSIVILRHAIQEFLFGRCFLRLCFCNAYQHLRLLGRDRVVCMRLM